MTNDPHATANRKAAIRWGGFVVALLAVQVAGGAAAIYLASHDPSAAVVPNYHEKALNWDREMALQRQSASLDWQVQLIVSAGSQHPGLVVQITDAEGKFVPIAEGDVRLYHHARAANILRVPIAAATAGPIVVADCFTRPGLWQVDLDVVDTVGNHYVDSNQLRIGMSDSGAS